MASHKSRSGQVIVCYMCRQGLCEECCEDQLTESAIVCHCPKCKGPCGEHGCEVEKVRRRKVAGKKVCGTCWTTSCDCGTD
jgi:hypothetical protein